MINKEVFEFIESKIGIPVDEATVYFEDTGIDGLDADVFMGQIAEEYNIDMELYCPEKYNMSEYELGNIFLTIYRAIFDRQKIKKINFNGQHLLDVIERGKWFDPIS